MSITQLSHFVDADSCQRLVIKVGSSLLVGKDRQPRREWLASLVAEIAAAKERGQEIVVVSSGAIALGAGRLKLKNGGRGSLANAQAAAAVGQIALAELWSELLGGHGIIAAQLLLTLDDLEGRRRYLNASATLRRLLRSGAIPVVNENDSVATAEIRFGDNDRLAARVAQAADAHGVLLLSDIDGLYDRNPSDPEARMLTEVHGVTSRIFAMATSGSGSGMGSGGMKSKLQAAQIAGRAGITLAIINGTPQTPIKNAVDGNRGTIFFPRRNDTARKSWLGGRMRMKGCIQVDAGCAAALRNGGSLLAAGIASVDGSFKRGDPVAVSTSDGSVIAQGLVEYDAGECLALKGVQSRDQKAILGYAPRAAVIHRSHLVVL